MGMVRLAVVITCALALGACSDGGDSGGPRAEPGPACPGGLDECGSGCTDLSSDPANCGACGAGCGDLFCLAGACSADCGALANCSGACIDIMTDSRNCGTCGADCGPGASCLAGMCQCGSETVSFAGDLQPIFNASCASAGCHDGGPGRPGPMGGKSSLDLTDGSSFASLLNATSNCGPVVVPGDPEGSLLIGKLTGLALCTGSQMPKGDPPLADNLIDTIATWICQGAEDN